MMMSSDINYEKTLEKTLDVNDDILVFIPNYIASEVYPGLGRIGLINYVAGDRGWYCER